MLNELGYIEPCLRGFPRSDLSVELLEILVIDGGSTDGSRELVEEMAAGEPRLSLVDNPRRVAAAAANLGIERARGEVLCFLSAHGVPDREYVATSVHLLQETGAVGVGGRYEHVGTNPASRAVGLAMASPFGMASPHRTGTEQGDVDTISHPTFWRQPMVEAGGYDERLISNEDYEFNYRLRLAGGRLVFCPEISSVYRPRGSLRALSRQFFAYGRGKAAVLRRHPASVRGRHLVPPIAVLGGGVLFAAAIAGRRRPLVAAVAGYGTVLVASFVQARPDRHQASPWLFVAAMPVMHASWGAGMLVGLTADARPPRPMSDERATLRDREAVRVGAGPACRWCLSGGSPTWQGLASSPRSLGFVWFLVAARAFDEQDFGLLSTGLVLVVVIGGLSDLGLTRTIVRHVAAEPRSLRSVYVRSVVLRAGAGVVVAARHSR